MKNIPYKSRWVVFLFSWVMVVGFISMIGCLLISSYSILILLFCFCF